MNNNRKPVPFFNRGPDPERCNARDVKRWTIFGGDNKKDGFRVKVVVNSGWGYRETIGSVGVPLIGFLLFGSMCLAIRYHDPQKENVWMFFLCIVGICLLQIPFFATLIWLEDSYFSRLPSQTITIFDNREFSINGEKARYELTPGSVLRYTIYYPEPSDEGGSYSELDLVVRDGKKEIAVHQLMAFEHNWCWKPAQKLSELSGVPLKRVVRYVSV